MKVLKVLSVLLALVLSLAIAQPAIADPISKKSTDYPVITQALTDLLTVQKDPNQTQYKADELQQKIADFKLQKYILESAEDWGTCRNETGKTLAVYASKPKQTTNTLYYLAAGEELDDEYKCAGIYLPSDAKIADFSLPAGEAIALKVLDGAQLVATADPDTGEIALNTPSALTTLIKTGEPGWSIPALTQADIDAQKPNAPTD